MTSPIIANVTNAPVRRPGDGQTGTFYRPQLVNTNPIVVGSPTSDRVHDRVRVLLSGPFFFTGNAAAAEMVDEVKYRVASQALADVQSNLDRSIRHPTPYYETQITLQQREDDWIVHDRQIVYGPWLEGTSSRNRTTRFKGYRSFRRAFLAARYHAPQVTYAIAQRFIDRMNA